MSVIDGHAGTVVNTVHLGGSPRGVAVDPLGGTAYVSTAGGGTAVVDTYTGRVAGLLDCGPGAYGVTVSAGGTIIVADRTDKSLFVVRRRPGSRIM
jgi:DNA-binding beta-propeller fold protein YncE